MSYSAGHGLKKPLNMIQSPVYADIRQAPPEFKWSKKHWDVDVGKVMMETEANTHLYDDAILARSYRDNIDKYGQSSHQEKITVFRPPLQNTYEDHGPLNRLPVKLHAITPHINPGTTNSSGGTSGYAENNMVQQEVSRYITDQIDHESWRQTYYMPIDTSLQNAVLPDLVINMPSYSTSAGYEPIHKINAPNLMDGQIIEHHNLPTISAHSGYTTSHTPGSRVGGNHQLENLQLTSTKPSYSVSSGVSHFAKIDGEHQLNNMVLINNLPTTSVSSGYKAIHTIDGEHRLSELEFKSHINSKLSINNPGSDEGYQTRVDSYTSPDNYIKLKENPKVAVAAHQSFDYRNVNNMVTPQFRSKLEPAKSYGNGLNSGTIRTAGVQPAPVSSRYIRNKSL